MSTTTIRQNRWYAVPEVWLMLVLLGATVAGSLALVGTAFAHRDDLLQAAPAIASPLPPTAAPRVSAPPKTLPPAGGSATR
jgi:hypothetical protein